MKAKKGGRREQEGKEMDGEKTGVHDILMYLYM